MTVESDKPALRPFSPFSSSSSRRKLRGTLADMAVVLMVVAIREDGWMWWQDPEGWGD